MFCHCGLHSLDTLLGTLCLEQNCLNSSCWENSSDFGPHWSCATFKVTYINFLSHSDARLIFSRLPWSCLHTLICHVTDMIRMTDLRIRYSETFASNFFQTHETQTDLSVFYFLCVVFLFICICSVQLFLDQLDFVLVRSHVSIGSREVAEGPPVDKLCNS